VSIVDVHRRIGARFCRSRPPRNLRQPRPYPRLPFYSSLAAPPRISPPADLALATTANLDHTRQSWLAPAVPRLPMHPPTRDGSSPPCPSHHNRAAPSPAKIGLDEEGLGGGLGGERREGDEQRAGGGEEDRRGDEEQEKQKAKTSTMSSLPSSSERSSSSARNNLTEGGRCHAQPVT
jgi:hypothetical protein